jgi:hypothetical protein
LTGKWLGGTGTTVDNKPYVMTAVEDPDHAAYLGGNNRSSYNSFVFFACRNQVLIAGVVFSGATENSAMLAVDNQQPFRVGNLMPLGDLEGEDKDSGFIFPAAERFAELLRAHDRLSVVLRRGDQPVTLGFDIRGFTEASKPVFRACNMNP